MRGLAAALALAALAAAPTAEARRLAGFESGLPGIVEGSSVGPDLPDCSPADLFSPADREAAVAVVGDQPGLPVPHGSAALMLSTSPLSAGPDDLRQSRWRLVFELEEAAALSFALAFRTEDRPDFGDWFLVALDGSPVACGSADELRLEDGRTGWRSVGADGAIRLEAGSHVLEAAVGDGIDAGGRSDLLLDAFELRPLHEALALPPTECRPHPPEDVGEIPTLCILPPITDCSQPLACTSPRRVWTFDDNRFCPDGSAGRDADGDGLLDCLGCSRPENGGNPNPPGSCFECTNATDRFFEMYVVADCGTEMHLPLNDVESGCISIFDQDRNPIDIVVDNGDGFHEEGGEVCWFAEDCDGNGTNDPGGPGNERVMDVRFTEDPALCGVFIARFRSWAGCIWDLFANCDGTDREQFLIFDDLCEAEDAYDPLPELIVENLVTSPGEGCSVDYCVEVTNIGCRIAQRHSLRVANEDDAELHDVPVLRSGETARFCGNLSVTSDGTDPQFSRVVAFADWENDLLECTEDLTASSCNAASGGDVISKLQELNCNSAPTCDAGGPYSAECTAPETAVPLDGTGSSDPDDQSLQYLWTTSCLEASFDDPSSATPVLFVPAPSCDLECSVELTVTDPDGLSETCSAPVTIRDTTLPEITCPADVDAECGEPGIPTRDEWLEQASAVDGCDPEATVRRTIRFQTNPCPGTRREVWDFVAVDACGNESAACEATWAVSDTTPPVLSLPDDRVVECPDDPEADVNAWASAASAEDACEGGVRVVRQLVSVEPGCGGTELRVYRFRATDGCGNSAEDTRTWQSVDTTPPVLRNVPGDRTVRCDAVPAPAPVRADDACDDAATVELEETREPGDCPDRFVLVRTWTGRDACGNEVEASQRISVTDDEPPVLSGVPADVTVECDAVPEPASPTASDDCDPSPGVAFDESRTDGDCPDRYTLTRTWTATDRCGNSVQASQTLTVRDLAAPLLTGVPGDATVPCDAVPPPATVSAVDDCDPSPELSLLETREDGDCPDRYVLVRTWTATDRCGNGSTATRRLTVVDDTPPALEGVPEDAAVSCSDVPPPAEVSASDDCDPEPLVEYSEQREDGDCEDDYTLTRSWTARDRCGNTASAVQVLDVRDISPPELVGLPEDLMARCDDIPPPPLVTAVDDCDPEPVVSFEQRRTDGACEDDFLLIRTWRALDRCGNETVGEQVISVTVTVRDEIPPELHGVPADAEAACDRVPGPADVSATDNCDPLPVVELVEERIDGPCPDSYTLVRTWTATDRCGNQSEAFQRLTVRDETPPVLAGVPADETVECDAVPEPASPTASDDCDPSPAVAFDEARTDGDCPDRYTLTRTWTATDRCGNRSSEAQVITVRDTRPPVLSGLPADETVECDAVPEPASPSASDDCDPNPVIAFDEQRTDGDCPFRYTLTRTWTATDRCGNRSSEAQVLTVEDTTPPEIAPPADLEVECPAPGAGPRSEAGWRALATATDNCGTPTVLSAELSRTPRCGATYEAVFEFWAVDECGNESARETRRYVVVDTTPPVLSAPADLTVECPAPSSGPGSEEAWRASASATDACGTPEVRSELVERLPGCGNTYTDVWDFWAVDECGNESARERRRYEVVDTTPPVFDGSEPLFDESLWPPQHGYVVFTTSDMASATDACGEVVLSISGCASSQPEEVHQGRTHDGGNGDGRTFEDCVWAEDGTQFAARAERLGACGPGSVRHYAIEVTATDECGNSATAEGLLRVEHDRRGQQDVRRGRKLGPNDPPPFPYVHEASYGEGCGRGASNPGRGGRP